MDNCLWCKCWNIASTWLTVTHWPLTGSWPVFNGQGRIVGPPIAAVTASLNPSAAAKGRSAGPRPVLELPLELLGFFWNRMTNMSIKCSDSNSLSSSTSNFAHPPPTSLLHLRRNHSPSSMLRNSLLSSSPSGFLSFSMMCPRSPMWWPMASFLTPLLESDTACCVSRTPPGPALFTMLVWNTCGQQKHVNGVLVRGQ